MQLHRERQEFEAAGVDLVIIGNGTPNFIDGFRERAGYTGPIYTDPELAAYRALELKRSVRSALNLKSVGRAFKAFKQGNRQGKTRGDAWQQGGVFVVTRQGEITYEHRSEYAGDHPPVADILAAAHAAA